MAHCSEISCHDINEIAPFCPNVYYVICGEIGHGEKSGMSCSLYGKCRRPVRSVRSVAGVPLVVLDDRAVSHSLSGGLPLFLKTVASLTTSRRALRLNGMI
jgi:hypothetical protein